jgi:hypothetical protein
LFVPTCPEIGFCDRFRNKLAADSNTYYLDGTSISVDDTKAELTGTLTLQNPDDTLAKFAPTLDLTLTFY